MKTLAHDHRHSGHGGGGFLAALLVVALLAGAVWGAWRLGVMAGDKVEWRQRLEAPLTLRRGPNPQPAPLPIQRRPGVEAGRP